MTTWLRIRQCDCQGQVNIMIAGEAEEALRDDVTLYPFPCRECGAEIKTMLIAEVTDMERTKLEDGDGRLLSVNFKVPHG